MDPADIAVLVEKFRLFAGDVAEQLNDTEIEIYLEGSQWSVYRSLEKFYLKLAADASIEEKSVKDYDLSVDTKGRSARLLAIAAQWGAMADEEDEQAGTADILEIHPVGLREPHPRHPELAPWPLRRW